MGRRDGRGAVVKPATRVFPSLNPGRCGEIGPRLPITRRGEWLILLGVWLPRTPEQYRAGWLQLSRPVSGAAMSDEEPDAADLDDIDVDLEFLTPPKPQNCLTCISLGNICSGCVPGGFIPCPWAPLGRKCINRFTEYQQAIENVTASLADRNAAIDCGHWRTS